MGDTGINRWLQHRCGRGSPDVVLLEHLKGVFDTWGSREEKSASQLRPE